MKIPSSQVTPTHLPQSNVTKVANVVPVGLLASPPVTHVRFSCPVHRHPTELPKRSLWSGNRYLISGFSQLKRIKFHGMSRSFGLICRSKMFIESPWAVVYTYFGHKCKPIRPTHGGISLSGQTVKISRLYCRPPFS